MTAVEVGQRVARMQQGRFGATSGDFGTVVAIAGDRLLVKWDGCRHSRIATNAEGSRWVRVPADAKAGGE